MGACSSPPPQRKRNSVLSTKCNLGHTLISSRADPGDLGILPSGFLTIFFLMKFVLFKPLIEKTYISFTLPTSHISHLYYKNILLGAGEMAQQWKALVVLPEDPPSIPQHPHGDSEPSVTPVPVALTLSSGPLGHRVRTGCTITHTYKELNFFMCIFLFDFLTPPCFS